MIEGTKVGHKEKEKSIFDDTESLIKLSKKLSAVYENRPEIMSFEGCMKGTKFESEYNIEELKRDENYIKETRGRIEKDEQNSFDGEDLEWKEKGFQLSEIMQVMVIDLMNKNWFKNTKTIMTSDYDDLKVGIDAVLKDKRGGFIGTSFDFTISNQEKIINKKLNKNWDENIKDGRIPRVKYFQDPDTKEKGKLLVPKFIIGALKKDVEEFVNAYLSGNEKDLEQHPFKYLLLLQIEEQLQTVLDLYETSDDPKLNFAKNKYREIQTMLRFMKKEIHLDEKARDLDLYEYSKGSIALNTMRQFRMKRGREM
ncbi:MAG TPA: hypothetical protein PKZ36_03335 [Candidatus Paceibacterota bacterium]|nr:hypothetical protein [Candidatus Paceibacterota bacterium]HPT18410.1 hypothetical protein [Candidatus Paceibacterota bacterium]